MTTLTRISIFFLAAVAFSCSDKESEEPWGLTGTVQGKNSLYSEFGATEAEQSGVTVSFQSGNTSKSTTTDSNGKFVAEGLPMGTYNLVLEKTGFASRTIPGIRVIGGENPMYTVTSMSRPSTTTITDLTAIPAGNSVITLGAKVNHNSNTGFAFVYYAVFVGTTADVSPTKYAQSSLYYFNGSSGSLLSAPMYLDFNKFPSGSTAYVVAYGATNLYTFDQQTQVYVYNGLGPTPSNVVSVVIP